MNDRFLTIYISKIYPGNRTVIIKMELKGSDEFWRIIVTGLYMTLDKVQLSSRTLIRLKQLTNLLHAIQRSKTMAKRLHIKAPWQVTCGHKIFPADGTILLS